MALGGAGAGMARCGSSFMHVRLRGSWQLASRDSACHWWLSERFVGRGISASSSRAALEVLFQRRFHRSGGLVDVARMMFDCELMCQTS